MGVQGNPPEDAARGRATSFSRSLASDANLSNPAPASPVPTHARTSARARARTHTHTHRGRHDRQGRAARTGATCRHVLAQQEHLLDKALVTSRLLRQHLWHALQAPLNTSLSLPVALLI